MPEKISHFAITLAKLFSYFTMICRKHIFLVSKWDAVTCFYFHCTCLKWKYLSNSSSAVAIRTKTKTEIAQNFAQADSNFRVR